MSLGRVTARSVEEQAIPSPLALPDPGAGPNAAERPDAVRRRCICYIHGFDPRGPAPYHRLLQQEASRHAALRGGLLQLGRRHNKGRLVSQWSLDRRTDDTEVKVDFLFLRWDDIARQRWTRGRGALLAQLFTWIRDMSRSGGFSYARRGARPGYLAMLTAPIALIGCGMATIVLSLVIAAAGWLLIPPWGALLGLAGPFFGLRLWDILDRSWNISWLSCCFAFILDQAHNRLPPLEQRYGQFAEIILQQAADPEIDELLVVGHSQGTCVAACSLARALSREPELGVKNAKISLLTLGQSISLVTHLAGKGSFHDDLALLAQADPIFWLDVTSPSDGVSACGLHPLDGVTGAPPGRPARRSPRFHLILKPDYFRRVRRQPFEFHFQYLRTPDVAGGYNFFDLACSSAPLKEYRHRWTRFVQDNV